MLLQLLRDGRFDRELRADAAWGQRKWRRGTCRMKGRSHRSIPGRAIGYHLVMPLQVIVTELWWSL